MIASLRSLLASSVALVLICAVTPAPAQAAGCAACSSPACCLNCQGQEYRLVYQTVYEQHQVTACRIEYETVCEERHETRYRPITETATREQRYTVARPIVETSFREEPYIVNRPVVETAERDECYTVNRPVVETVYRTDYHTVYQPVTTCRTEMVDQGCYVDQTTVTRSWPYNKLTWQNGACVVDPVTGATVYQKPGLYWTPTNHGTYEVKRVWQPNLVPHQVQQVSYVPQTVAQQVPVQVCSVRPEVMHRKVPYQTCRIVQEQYTRKVPVQTCRMVYEEHVDRVPYQVCRMVPYQETVRIPHLVEKRVPVTYTCTVPRTVCCRVPVDACGNTIDPAAVPTVTTPNAAPLAPPVPAEEPAPHRAASHTRAAVDLMSQAESSSSEVLQGKRLSFVGRLAGMSRREAAQLVRRHGATVLEEPDASANLLVVGEEGLPLPDEASLEDWPERRNSPGPGSRHAGNHHRNAALAAIGLGGPRAGPASALYARDVGRVVRGAGGGHSALASPAG